MKQNELILLGHGSGGRLSHTLISQLFMKHFQNPLLLTQGDAALPVLPSGNLAFTTDSFVVDPLFFPGGDIGKLAVAGTVNDLAVSGARAAYLSAGFIIEEGLPFEVLERVVKSMAAEAAAAGVWIVTGDTKVVERGKCDKLFINTSGIGELLPGAGHISSGSQLSPGDKIILNGSIGDHGMVVMAERNNLNISANIISDCASLNDLILSLDDLGPVRFMRDATRGGLGTVLAELSEQHMLGINITERDIPVKMEVRGMCEMLGFDPLYVANEGKLVMVVEPTAADLILKRLRQHQLGNDACIIGEITEDHPGRVWMKTSVGGHRIIDMPTGQQLPRIC